LSERVRRLHEDVRSLKVVGAELQEDVARVKSKVVRVRVAIAVIERRMDDFAEHVNERFDRLADLIRNVSCEPSNRDDAPVLKGR